MWARTDTTPFGHGRPYSRSQITALLRETWFTPTGWGEALYVPPIARSWFLRSAVAWERTGATLSAPFAGVHILWKQPSRFTARSRRGASGAGWFLRSNRCWRHRRGARREWLAVSRCRPAARVLAALNVVARAPMATTATMQWKTIRLPAAILVAVLALRLGTAHRP